MKVARRKSIPMRSPSASIQPFPKSENDVVAVQQDWKSSPSVVHDRAPATFGTPALQSLIYATSNDRYPGAPGTLLYKAKLEAARALAAKQREAQREIERREEMKRLGIVGMGKKRSTAGVNGVSSTSTSRFGTPPSSERARRSNPSPANGNSSSSSTGVGSRTTGRGNGRNGNGSTIDHNSLPAASSSQQDNKQVNGTGSPLLSSSGRLRRPANGSRGASPMPLTSSSNGYSTTTNASNGVTSGIVTRTRSPVVAPLEIDDEAASKLGPSSLGLNMTTADALIT